MNDRFADTSFFVSYLNRRDTNHRAAAAYMNSPAVCMVTTVWVLLELGNWLARVQHRQVFVPFVRQLRRQRWVTILSANEASLDVGMKLYERRPDKDWSLTDCISFVVMEERGLTEALTADHHFEQAGFNMLLK